MSNVNLETMMSLASIRSQQIGILAVPTERSVPSLEVAPLERYMSRQVTLAIRL